MRRLLGTNKFWAGVLAVVLFVGVPAADVATLALDGRPSCLRIDEYVAANAAALPQTLDELSAYPVAYRQKIYAAATPVVRSSLWKEHFVRFARSRTLTAEQSSFVSWL